MTTPSPVPIQRSDSSSVVLVSEDPPPSYVQSDIISHGYKMITQVLVEPIQEYFCEAKINDQFFIRFQIFPFAAGAQRVAFRGSIYERVEKAAPLFCAHAVAKFEMSSTYLIECSEEVRTRLCAEEAEKTVRKHTIAREFVNEWKGLGINKDVYVLSTEKMIITKGCSLTDISQQYSPMLYYLFKLLSLDTVLYTGATGTVEDQLPGKFTKFLNNDGRANDEVSANFPGAFAHWTWVQSGGRIMVSDIQGVRSADGYTLTDPCVHSVGDPHGYGRSDLGFDGVEEFFTKHKCNELCRDLKLTGHGIDVDLGHNIRTRLKMMKGQSCRINEATEDLFRKPVIKEGTAMHQDDRFHTNEKVSLVKRKKSEEMMKMRERAASEGHEILKKQNATGRRHSFWLKEKDKKKGKDEKIRKWTNLLLRRRRNVTSDTAKG